MICFSTYQSMNEASKINLKVRQSCLGLNLDSATHQLYDSQQTLWLL